MAFASGAAVAAGAKGAFRAVMILPSVQKGTMAALKTKLATGGFRTFYNGGLGAVMANIVGYYPWFATYNTL